MAEAYPEEADDMTVPGSLSDVSSRFICRLKENGNFTKVLEEQITGSKTHHELFTNIWNLKEAHEVLTPVLEETNKCEIIATEHGREGNKAYQERNYATALDYFNNSIMAAPHPTVKKPVAESPLITDEGDSLNEWPLIDPEKYGGCDSEGADRALAIAYGNRSALMMTLGLYEICLNDIELALKHSYPEDIKDKLLARKKRCLAAKRKKKMGGEVSKPYQKSPDNTQKTEKDSSIQYTNDFLEKLVEHLSVASTEDDPLGKSGQLSPGKLPVIKNKSPSYPAFSDSVKIAYHSSKGRYAVADKDIPAGELVAVESAYCIGFITGYNFLLCAHCLRFTLAPIPCPGCTMFIFCNDDCRIKGLSEDHWLECKMFASMRLLGIGPMCPIYKMLRNFNFKGIKDFRKKLVKQKPEDPAKLGCDNNGIYLSQSYRTIYGLIGDEVEMSHQQVFIDCQIAFIVTKLLQMSGRFFLTNKGEPFTPTREDLIYTGTVILSHIYKCHFSLVGVSNSKMERDLGAGVFPTMALINHSCDANLKFFTVGRSMVVRAIRPIQAGEELTVSYGNAFEYTSLLERRIVLAKYQIDCLCKACVNRWPTYPDLEDLRLSDIRRTPRVRKIVSEVAWKAVDKAMQIKQLYDDEEKLNEEDYKAMCKASAFAHKELVRDCRATCDIRNALLMCFMKVPNID